jgi:DNA integrity scanning protein DisA with diadenylate cyclase activity
MLFESTLGERAGAMSRVVGLYQTMLRRSLELFFPDGILEPAGDRSFIALDPPDEGNSFRFADDPEGFGVEIEWFRTRYLFLPGTPVPFLPSERHLIESVVKVIDRRYRSMFDPEALNREEMFQYAVEDLIIAEDLKTPEPIRIPAALEALRVGALSTYENRRVSTGVLLLGTGNDPTAPNRKNLPDAPRYGVRLSAIKTIHRICDGIRTLFLVDRRGDLAWAVDIGRWAAEAQGDLPLKVPCPRPYHEHARATLTGGHVALVLSPAQEIKVFAQGTLMFAFSDSRWRILDIPSKFALWRDAVGRAVPSDLAERIFQASLNLSERRRGALFVVLRDPASSIPLLVAPSDRIQQDLATNDSEDLENVSPRHVKRALHHLARFENLGTMDASVLESLAGVDGAVVTDQRGQLLSFGAILRVAPETVLAPRAVEGARTTAALAASYHGPVLKVSEDGYLTMFLSGRRVWEL